MTIQNELDAVENKDKEVVKRNQQMILDRYFGVDPVEVKGRFADPALFFQ